MPACSWSSKTTEWDKISNILKSHPVLFRKIYFKTLSCHLAEFIFFCPTCLLPHFKMSWLQAAWCKAILLRLQSVMWREEFTAVKLQDHWQDTSWTQGTSVWTSYFVINSYFWGQSFLRKAGNQSFSALALGIKRSSHILSKVATSHSKIFHISSLSVSALQSNKGVKWLVIGMLHIFRP